MDQTGQSEKLPRCPWAESDPLYSRYHDDEWGVPSFDDRHLFEMLILEGAQAGLSWITVLKKRRHYAAAFDGFDAQRMARYSPTRVQALMTNPGIIRNRAKIESAVRNAGAFLAIIDRQGDFSTFIWQFVDGRPIVNRWDLVDEIPAFTTQSENMSRELKRRGFSFVGKRICYAFMQAVGMVNDHIRSCYRYRHLQQNRTVR